MIRPYVDTRTFRNLVRAREAVVNVTDDVLIFAKSALSRERLPSRPAAHVQGVILADACHWREVAVEDVVVPVPAGGRRPGRRDHARRGGRGEPPFAGLCRAKHAVVEASILASRARWLPRDEVLQGLDRLDPLVDRTGGPAEREAMAYIRAHVGAARRRLTRPAPSMRTIVQARGAAPPGVPRPQRSVRAALRVDRRHAGAAALHGGGGPGAAGTAATATAEPVAAILERLGLDDGAVAGAAPWRRSRATRGSARAPSVALARGAGARRGPRADPASIRELARRLGRGQRSGSASRRSSAAGS